MPRDELLELAGRQRADGSFGPIKDSSAVRLGSTAHALLQMLLADELRRPLKKQIQRGIEYLLEHARLLQGEENNIAAAICAVIVLSLRYRILAGASADAGRELCATLRELLPERELPERLQQAADEEEIKRILQESHLIP